MYAYTTTNGQQQQWSSFGLQSGSGGVTNPAANEAIVDDGLGHPHQRVPVGLVLELHLHVAVSWDKGGTWRTTQATRNLGTNTAEVTTRLAPPTTRRPGEAHLDLRQLSDAHFRVRVTAAKGCSTSNHATPRRPAPGQGHVHSHHAGDHDLAADDSERPDPLIGTALASQGFWGAIFTSGGVRENGDKYAPSYIGGNRTLPTFREPDL